MADNNRNPQQQQNDPQRRAPGQQQQQGQPRQPGQNEQGRNPGGQANQQDDNVRRGDR